jgi:hypothetical protein
MSYLASVGDGRILAVPGYSGFPLVQGYGNAAAGLAATGGGAGAAGLSQVGLRPIAASGGSLMNSTFTVAPPALPANPWAAAAFGAAIGTGPFTSANVRVVPAVPPQTIAPAIMAATGYQQSQMYNPELDAGSALARTDGSGMDAAALAAMTAAVAGGTRCPPGVRGGPCGFPVFPAPPPLTSVGNVAMQDSAASLGYVPVQELRPLGGIASAWPTPGRMPPTFYTAPVGIGMQSSCGYQPAYGAGCSSLRPTAFGIGGVPAGYGTF